jgi:hypothetical protein
MLSSSETSQDSANQSESWEHPLSDVQTPSLANQSQPSQSRLDIHLSAFPVASPMMAPLTPAPSPFIMPHSTHVGSALFSAPTPTCTPLLGPFDANKAGISHSSSLEKLPSKLQAAFSLPHTDVSDSRSAMSLQQFEEQKSVVEQLKLTSDHNVKVLSPASASEPEFSAEASLVRHSITQRSSNQSQFSGSLFSVSEALVYFDMICKHMTPHDRQLFERQLGSRVWMMALMKCPTFFFFFLLVHVLFFASVCGIVEFFYQRSCGCNFICIAESTRHSI